MHFKKKNCLYLPGCSGCSLLHKDHYWYEESCGAVVAAKEAIRAKILAK
jgi:hypothetical protein